jgi:hypothetical protein
VSDAGLDSASKPAIGVDSGDSGSHEGTTLGRFCKAYVDRDKRCSPADTSPGRSNCETSKDYACLAAIARPGMLDATSACVASLECRKNDDHCPEAVAANYAPYTEFANDCLGKQASCKGDAGRFEDDVCGRFTAIFKDPLLTAMGACLAKPCGEIGKCIETAVRQGDPSCANTHF